MKAKQYLWIIILIVMITLGIGCLVTNSINYEAISVDSLDRVCKLLLNDNNIKYDQSIGLQKEFRCKNGNEIIIIKKYAHLNKVLDK